MKNPNAQSAKTCAPCNLVFETLTACRMHRRRKHSNPNAVSLGSLGGRAKTEKKAEAARENGKKGGRPKSKSEIPT